MTTRTIPALPAFRPLDLLAGAAERALPPSLLALVARFAAASVFWLSGRTKVEGVLTIKDTTFFLFAEEYKSRCCRPRSRPTSPPTPNICSRSCWLSAC